MADYQEEDIGNIISLEHVNVQIPDQSLGTLFYLVGLGLTRDPYINVGLNNMWVNAGEQQFHLPTRPPQVVPGHIGLIFPSLDALEARLKSVAEPLKGTRFAWRRVENRIEATCPWGNYYRCFAAGTLPNEFSLGMPYVEFLVSPRAMPAILRFYHQALLAPVRVESDQEGEYGAVAIGRDQSLRFRETSAVLPPYDGHHVAIYVANFSRPYDYLKSKNLLSEDVRNHQFRFKDIVDPETGTKVFALEHEVRSLKHPMYHRFFVNRNAGQSQRAYRRGDDAANPFAV